MAIGMHNIKSAKGSRQPRKRVGRGLGSTGTYSGRGGKGQTARSGVSGLRRLGMKRTLLSTPKLRGFKSLQTKPAVISLEKIAEKFDGTIEVNLATIKAAGIIRKSAKAVKILGDGEVKVKLNIKGCDLSASAREKIEKAGGKIL